MTQILTNITGTSIVLTLNLDLSSPSIKFLGPGESVLYDDIVVSDTLDPHYNLDLINEYIGYGILQVETLTDTKQSEVQIYSPANLSVILTRGIPELISKSEYHANNLQILPVVDNNGKLLCIYYKTTTGMAYSLDGGITQIGINNDNLIYPEEITSFAAQTYDSINGVLVPVARLFIGTLREGVKTYVPGDITYLDFEPNAGFDTPDDPYNAKALFRHVTLTTTLDYTVTENPPKITNTKEYNDFCPTFILTLPNNPYNSGCPIFIASRSKYTLGTKIINGIDDVTEYFSSGYEMRVFFKYLHAKVYRDGILADTINEANIPYYYTDMDDFTSRGRWVLLQSLDPASEGGIDVEDVSSIIMIPELSGQILDTLSDYNSSGSIFLTRDDSGNNKLYEISLTSGVPDPTPPPAEATPENPTVYPVVITELAIPNELLNAKILNISRLNETASTEYNIFITTATEVWRYSTATKDAITDLDKWSNLINSNTTTTYFNTTLVNGILTPDPGVNPHGYLQELSNFILVPKVDTTNGYIGLLGTEIGIIFYDLLLVNNSFIAGAKSARTLLNNTAKSIVSDIKLYVNGPNIQALTCSIAAQYPRTFKDNINCSTFVNNNSKLSYKVYYLKPDIELTTQSPYYVSVDGLSLNYINSDEQLSYDPVLISNEHQYAFKSPTYTFKLKSFPAVDDDTLTYALTSFLGYKYYIPAITERIVSGLNEIETASLVLNNYKHFFKVNNIGNINTDLNTGFESILFFNKATSILIPVAISDVDPKSIVCIKASDNSVVVPQSLTQTLDNETRIVFSSEFTGNIFITPATPQTYAVSGLFQIITHGLDKYPQVLLDSSVLPVLNDIKYVDQNRLELSFSESVETTVTLI